MPGWTPHLPWRKQDPSIAVKVMEVTSYRHAIVRHMPDNFTDKYLTIRKQQIKENVSICNVRFKSVLMLIYTAVFFVLKNWRCCHKSLENNQHSDTEWQFLFSQNKRIFKLKVGKFRINNRIPIFTMCISTVESLLLESIESKELMSL